MNIYWLQSKRDDDDEAEADPFYLEWLYKQVQISCPKCWDIRREYRNSPLDIDLTVGSSLTMLVTAVSYVGVVLVRTDLLDCLRPWMTDFHIGTVTVQQQPLDTYRTVLASRSVRIDYHGQGESYAGKSYIYNCPECERRFARIMLFGTNYVLRSELVDLVICTDVIGKILQVREEVLAVIPKNIRSELYENEIPVRDGSALVNRVR